MTLELRIDRERCRGSRCCVRSAPGSFALNEDGRAMLIEPPADSEELLRAAASACPFFAIQATPATPARESAS